MKNLFYLLGLVFFMVLVTPAQNISYETDVGVEALTLNTDADALVMDDVQGSVAIILDVEKSISFNGIIEPEIFYNYLEHVEDDFGTMNKITNCKIANLVTTGNYELITYGNINELNIIMCPVSADV